MEASGRLIEVGYWAAARPYPEQSIPSLLETLLPKWATPYPRVDDFIDTSWSATERAKVIDYLQRGRRHERYMGVSNCRLCGQDNGCLDLTDGVYVWPDGFAHYVREHAVKPPQAFVDHVLGRP